MADNENQNAGVSTPVTNAPIPAATRKGKTYESSAIGRGFYGSKVGFKFLPDTSLMSTDFPLGIGVLRSDEPRLLKMPGASVEAIEKIIEDEPDYRNNKSLFEKGVFGKNGKPTGIWEREWRIAAQGKIAIGSIRDQLAALGIDGLKAVIAQNGGKPMTSGKLDDYVNAALQAIAAKAT